MIRKRGWLPQKGQSQSRFTTYFESHGVDQTLGLSFGIDLTPSLIHIIRMKDPPGLMNRDSDLIHDKGHLNN